MVTGPQSEVGRELTADELVGRERTIVVLRKEGKPTFVTVWLASIDKWWVQFEMGEIRTTLILERRADGTLCDDSGTQVHVFEYLPAGGVAQQ